MLVNYIIIIQSLPSTKQTNNQIPIDYLQKVGFNKKVLIVCQCSPAEWEIYNFRINFDRCLKLFEVTQSDSRLQMITDRLTDSVTSDIDWWLLAWFYAPLSLTFSLYTSGWHDGCKSQTVRDQVRK